MISGILNLDKPRGWTSHDAVAKVRNILNQQQVGHAGTLDPNATGVLILCLGKATKLSRYFMRLEKEYHGFFRFGISTDSQDVDGEVTSEGNASVVTEERLREMITRYTGEIMQTPPMVSAVKVNGKRLYRLARKGETVEREPRRINVRSFELLKYEEPVAEVNLVCSKGTYVRSLAADIGDEFGCGAHLDRLTRVRIGGYHVDQATSLEDLSRLAEEGNLESAYTPVEGAIEPFTSGVLKNPGTRWGAPPLPRTLASLHPIEPLPGEGEFLRITDHGGRSIGVVEVGENRVQLRKVLVIGN